MCERVFLNSHILVQESWLVSKRLICDNYKIWKPVVLFTHYCHVEEDSGLVTIINILLIVEQTELSPAIADHDN
jgi:hypothetical protein